MRFSIFIVIFIAFATSVFAEEGTTFGTAFDLANKSVNEKLVSDAAVLGQDHMAPAGKRVGGNWVKTISAWSSDQCLRAGGCTRPFPFPPKKPKGPKTKLAHYDTDGTRMADSNAFYAIGLYAISRQLLRD